ncbi:V-set and immunoglobulin domain-containing protein 4-like [Onychostruthus taczanowskii]|uniref:V-set and immunoglobulin domain-containing protein 4-like n=1 Tax=Onychostruthus taczanowskii TaxID=356909 RepID=UPI001B80AEDE|nr:V-set and immunoglobulin domain-containing protein 4-like [Onychostruthus taczanowskii]XP_041252692.1 V-set and immunoglobulin domain-containing protein 4-like [Onychostruthus taczanowskii]
MGEVGWIVLFVMTFISCNAFLDLSSVHQVTGTWMGSTTVPCTYVPSEDFTQQTLSWSLERDSSTSTIFRRDDSGDHILLSKFRGRVSVQKHSPGDASLRIQNLEIPDSGHYTCQIIWRSRDNSLITREVTTIVKVVKVAATKPIIRAAGPGLTLPAGASTRLSCEAGGSPPISYRWFRAGRAEPLSSGAELAWPSLRPSDSGTYFCEAHNRAGAGAAQRSDAVQLTVTDLPTTTVALQRNVGTTRGHHSTTGQEDSSDMEHTVTDPVPTTRVSRMDTAPVGPFTDTGSPRLAASPLLYGLPAALGGAALGALLAAGLGCWRRRRRKDEPLYEVAFRRTADVALLHPEVEVPAKCLQEETCSSTEKTTVKDRKSPEYENLVTAMESQYGTEGIY